jgi:hypothetical protein
MKSLISIVLFIAALGFMNAQTLLHKYEFNGDLTDELSGPDLIPIHTATSGFADGAWSWTGTSHPGGGLLLRASLIDAEEYSLRIVFKYNNFYSSWTKILSFQGYMSGNHYFSSDHGLYFYQTRLQFYPHITNPDIVFSPNVWYDLVFTRNAAGLIRFYVTPLGQPQQLVLEFNDPDVQAVPSFHEGYNCWGLFYDDTATSSEWTSGGSVALVEVWGHAYAFDKVQNVSISNVGDQINLGWDPFPGALSYTVYDSDNPDAGPWNPIGNVPGTSANFTSAAARRFYHVRAELE